MFCVPAVCFPLVTQAEDLVLICDCYLPCFWCLPLGGQGWSRGLFQASWWEALVHAHSWVELGLGPLVGRDVWAGTCLKVVWGSGPALWVVWPVSPSIGSCRLSGGARSHSQRWKKCLLLTGVNIGPSCICHQLIWPQRATAAPPCPGDPWRPAGRSDPSCMRLLLLSRAGPCVHPPGVKSPFPSVLGVPATKPYWPSKPKAVGVPPNAGPRVWGAWYGAHYVFDCRVSFCRFQPFKLTDQQLWFWCTHEKRYARVLHHCLHSLYLKSV